RVTGGHHPNALGADEALVGFNADTHAIFLAETGDFGLLDQVHAQGVGSTGKAPGHGVVTRYAAATLYGCADDRVTGVLRAVQVWDLFGHLLAVEQFAIHAVQTVGATVQRRGGV